MKLSVLTIAAAVFALSPIGCNQSPPGGNTKANTSPVTTLTGGGKATFTLKGPTLSTTVKQGDRQTVDITVDRGSEFKEAIKLDAEAPKGVTAEFGKKTIEASDPADSKVTLTISAEKDAAVGDHVIHVKGTPATGAATSLEVKVKVEAKK